MFCSNCGIELPDEANFCWKCGKPQKSSVLANEPQWEICEINMHEVSTLKRRAAKQVPFVDLFVADMMVFEAKATGPKGVYIAATSKEFKYTSSQKMTEARDAFINDLVKDGWEPVPGSISPQFRRGVR